MDQPAIDEEEAEPRFLLSAGPAQADAVAAVLAAMQPVALLVGGGWTGRLGDVRMIAHEHGVALLVEDDLDLAAETDGIHLADAVRVTDSRQELDRRRRDHLIVGADVGLSHHDAMVAGEAGADYVAFGERDLSADDAVLECVLWWRSTTVLPCLAHAADAATVSMLARIGTDFIGVSSAVWDHPDGHAAAIRELGAAIEKI